MRTIWKFPLPTARTILSIPRDATPIRVGFQGEGMFLWCIVQSDQPMESRTFGVYGTGHAILESSRYIGSASQGPLEWHVFEEGAQ